MPGDPSTALVGREYEIGLLEGLVRDAPDKGGALVVRGEAGIGKSALLAAAGRAATGAGLRVLSTAGVESETHLAFAGLHRLLRPVLAPVEQLPGRQRDAVLAAFGMSDAQVSDLFVLALATLNLLAEAADGGPMLLLVEDAHWLDRASADVLVFVARRLEFEPVVLLAALRDGFEGPYADAGLPELRLSRLTDAAAAALLDARAPGLRPAVRRRVLEEAAGNPLALMELPAGLSGTTASLVLEAPQADLGTVAHLAGRRRSGERRGMLVGQQFAREVLADITRALVHGAHSQTDRSALARWPDSVA
jgi:hypothetical protein